MGHEPTHDKRGAALKGVRFIKGRTDEGHIKKGPSPNKEDLADVTLEEKGKIFNQQNGFCPQSMYGHRRFYQHTDAHYLSYGQAIFLYTEYM